MNRIILNNCDPKTNGEEDFFNRIKHNIHVIFDVGCRDVSEFTEFEKEVHYFDPVSHFTQQLAKKTNKNKTSRFNAFGLGSENKDVWYYPKYESFYNRVNSCKISDERNKIMLRIKKAKDYILSNNIQSIDFVKIDTEGHELEVLKGFEELLDRVKIIQFEYGGTFLDNGIKLIDVVNYLEQHGFHKFSYLTDKGIIFMDDFTDHYQYCNIVCINKNSDYVPY
jgi:FkbM family methyltransferase